MGHRYDDREAAQAHAAHAGAGSRRGLWYWIAWISATARFHTTTVPVVGSIVSSRVHVRYP